MKRLVERYASADVDEADVLICLGGDGFMLEALHKYHAHGKPIYGMNLGTVGFLMNEFSEEGLIERIERAEAADIRPLEMRAETVEGEIITHMAINEVSLLRSGPQAARLRVLINETERLGELVADGAMVSTPAGSTAYNYSAHGPIIPIGANILAITAVAAYRPRRWRGALVPMDVRIRIEVDHADKRPVHASADSFKTGNVRMVEIAVDESRSMRLLFDPGHGLEERLLNEQFQ